MNKLLAALLAIAFGSVLLLLFNLSRPAAVGIIGSADGPTAILVSHPQ